MGKSATRTAGTLFVTPLELDIGTFGTSVACRRLSSPTGDILKCRRSGQSSLGRLVVLILVVHPLVSIVMRSSGKNFSSVKMKSQPCAMIDRDFQEPRMAVKKLMKYSEVGSLWEPLKKIGEGEAPVVLLRGTWLCKLAAANGRLPKRQDLPAEAIWDWAEPRSIAEAKAFEESLKNVAIWYAHKRTQVWILTSTPETCDLPEDLCIGTSGATSTVPVLPYEA
eukprot:g4562.t1